jgi:amino acid permease
MSQREPLVPSQAGEEVLCCSNLKLGLQAFANLATGAIGVGVLSFPFAFKSSGILLTLCMMVLFSGVNVLTLGSLCYAKTVVDRRALQALSYEELVLRTLGPRAHMLAIVLVLVNQFGQMMACLIIIADLGTPVVHEALHIHAPDLLIRTVLVLFFLLLVCPLFAAERITSLDFTSWLAVAAVAVVRATRTIYYGYDSSYL